MTDNLHFINEKWFWPVVGAGIILWFIISMLVWFQGKEKHFLLKIILGFLASISLVLIALKPALPEELNTTEGMLLTPGYNKNVADSLKNHLKNAQTINYKEGADLSGSLDSLSGITILGNGIKPYDFWQFKDKNTRFLPGKLPSGIIKLKYDQQPVVDQDIEIYGVYNKIRNGNQLILQDPGGGSLDSVSLNKETSNFYLKAPLKVTGNLIYQIVEKDSLGKIVTKNPVPVEVQEQLLFNILIINDFPTFETKYLKDYLAEMGHEVVIRSQLTRERYKFEYFNTDPVAVSRLSQADLQEFDLLIIDAKSLRNQSKSAKSGMKSAIYDDGLGVFVQADLPFFRESGGVVSLKFKGDRNSSIRLQDFPQTVFTKNPFTFEDTFGLETINKTDFGIVSAYQRTGSGRVGSTVLETTYELLLEGKKETYTRLWTQLLSPLAKRNVQTTSWESSEAVIYKDEPFEFALYTDLANPEVKTGSANRVSLKQNFDLSQKWEGSTYPKITGWNTLALAQDSKPVLNYYVYETGDWQSLSTYETQQANKLYFNSQDVSTSTRALFKPINLWWFLVIFIVAMGVLWLLPKFED